MTKTYVDYIYKKVKFVKWSIADANCFHIIAIK